MEWDISKLKIMKQAEILIEKRIRTKNKKDTYLLWLIHILQKEHIKLERVDSHKILDVILKISLIKGIFRIKIHNGFGTIEKIK